MLSAQISPLPCGIPFSAGVTEAHGKTIGRVGIPGAPGLPPDRHWRGAAALLFVCMEARPRQFVPGPARARPSPARPTFSTGCLVLALLFCLPLCETLILADRGSHARWARILARVIVGRACEVVWAAVERRRSHRGQVERSPPYDNLLQQVMHLAQKGIIPVVDGQAAHGKRRRSRPRPPFDRLCEVAGMAAERREQLECLRDRTNLPNRGSRSTAASSPFCPCPARFRAGRRTPAQPWQGIPFRCSPTAPPRT